MKWSKAEEELYGAAYLELVRMPKVRARELVHYYLRTGFIKRLPCEYTGCCNKKAEAHHPNYAEPLTLVWLCRRHHKMLHETLDISDSLIHTKT